MSINLNDAAEQRSGTGRPIPPNSKVCVQLAIIHPDASRRGQSAPELTRSGRSSMEYLATTLTVTRGSFAGKVIYANFNLAGAQTQGQRQAVDISTSRIRAMVEAASGISPRDAGPQATQARMLNSWSDLEGLTCFIRVGCEESAPSAKDGRIYINNRLESVVTIDDPDYAELVQNGEIISPDPVPEPSRPEQAQPAQRPAWGAASPAPQAVPNPVPSWARKAPPPPVAGSESMDAVPF